jgi:hypothetical protein
MLLSPWTAKFHATVTMDYRIKGYKTVDCRIAHYHPYGLHDTSPLSLWTAAYHVDIVMDWRRPVYCTVTVD